MAPGAQLKVRLRYEASKSPAAIRQFRLSAAAGNDLDRELHGPRFTSWQVLGPLRAPDAATALLTPFGPETQVDLKKRYPGVREEAAWAAHPEFEDAKANLIVQDLHGIHGVRYLYRTIVVPKDIAVPIALRADGVFRLWVNGELAGARERDEAPGDGPLRLTVRLKTGENRLLVKLVTVQGASYFTFSPDLGSAESLSRDVAAILACSSTLTSESADKVRRFFRRQYAPDIRRLEDAVFYWRQEQEAIDRSVPTTLIAKESEQPRDTFILLRGEYDKKGEKVMPGVPAIFPPIPAGFATNRLGLAKWLVQPSHPLTARVTVNRMWQHYFGTGLVKTAEDFGTQGERPSHPELLDWLATEFIRSGWDVKHMHRLIVTQRRLSPKLSRQTRAPGARSGKQAARPRSAVSAGRRGRPGSSLYASGLLVEKIGGRSVRPYEPPGLWEAVSFNNSQKYVQDLVRPNTGAASIPTGNGKARRQPCSSLMRPSREYCTVRRSRSNTPLQALALLNDPQFVEISRAFAHRIMTEGGPSPETRANMLSGSRRPARPPPMSCPFFAGFTRNNAPPIARIATLLKSTWPSVTSRVIASLDGAELAAWTAVASIILNLDETITKG